MTPRRLLAEAIGTFILVFAGTSAIVADVRTAGAVGNTGVALTFGIAIAAGVFTTRRICGAHFNPAISVAMSAVGRFAWAVVPAYVVAQIAGALAASLSVRALFGDTADAGATLPSVALWKAFWIETVATAFLAFVIARVAAEASLPDALAAIAIGGAVALGALFAGPTTGGSMNPARSLAPALVSGELAGLWVYLTAPFLGATLGAVAYAAVSSGASYTESAASMEQQE
jgi:MIP family channel proteins